MLMVVMLSAIALNFVMLSAIALNAVMLVVAFFYFYAEYRGTSSSSSGQTVRDKEQIFMNIKA
jgi:hypothetical protein